MSTATIKQLGQDLSGWIATVQRGEIVAILDAGREVARLMPPEVKASATATDKPAGGWPDFAARRRAIFGDRVLPAGSAQALVDEDRGA